MPRNNLYGVAPASSVDMRSATLGVWDFRFLGRGYVSDSRIREQVGSVVPRAAVRQGTQLLRLRALWPVAGA